MYQFKQFLVLVVAKLGELIFIIIRVGIQLLRFLVFFFFGLVEGRVCGYFWVH